MSGEPIRRPHVPSPEPREAVRSEIHALCDLLVVRPLPKRPGLRRRALAALTACEEAGETGLPAHLLRNLLRDLASSAGPVDAAYYASHLTRALSRAVPS